MIKGQWHYLFLRVRNTFRKMEISLEKAEKEEKINNRESFVDFYQMDGTDFDSPEKISYSFIGVDLK